MSTDLQRAKSITDRAAQEHRSLTSGEKHEVESILEKVQEERERKAWVAGRLNEIPADRLAKLLAEKAEDDAVDAENMRRLNKMLNGGTVTNYTSYVSGGGFADAVVGAGWSLKGQRTVVVPLASALSKANTLPSAETWNVEPTGSIADQGADKRFMYRRIPQKSVTDETSISDFIASGRTLTGTAIRALDATTAKATVDVTVTAVNPELEQVAVVTSGIPVAVLESLPTAREFFNRELRLQIELATDNAAYAAIVTGAGAGGGGGGWITAVRNAVADMRDDGFNPNLLVVSSTIGAELDLSTTGTDSSFVFPLRDSGSASPLWDLTVVESQAAAGDSPLLIDTSAIGTLYLGGVRIDADPFAGAGGDNFVKNLVDLRAEGRLLMHVRRAAAAMVVDES